jgi:hypothetical protein
MFSVVAGEEGEGAAEASTEGREEPEVIVQGEHQEYLFMASSRDECTTSEP